MAGGESLRHICADDDLPNRATVARWLAVNPEFRDQYATICEMRAEQYAEEIVSIADEAGTRAIVSDDGDDVMVAFDATAVARNRLRVDARKWVSSKLLPKKYGDRQTIEHDVSGNLADQLKAARERAANR